MLIDYSKISSPCFVINEERFRKNLSLIKHVSDESGVEIILAFKGFAMWGVFPILREYISGAAASSVDEARLCFEEIGSRAHTYSPVHMMSEFNSIMKYSSHITFNSINQFRKYSHKLQNYPEKISAGLRINPEFSEVSHGLYNPCSPGSRLGIIAEDLKDGLPDGIEGLHFHVLFESDSYALEKVLKVVEARFGRFFPQLKWINMGGGHLITRRDYNTDHLIKILKQFREKSGLHIILEPGSAFAWETGELVATVEDIVENTKSKQLFWMFLLLPICPTVLKCLINQKFWVQLTRFPGNRPTEWEETHVYQEMSWENGLLIKNLLLETELFFWI